MPEKTLCIFLFLLLTNNIFCQKQEPLRTIVSSTTIGMGNSDILDTYLTPLDYKGWSLEIRNERMQAAKKGNGNRINQQLIWGDYSSNSNQAENGMIISCFGGYSFGTLWKKHISKDLILLGGGYASAETGFIYNLRNGNNPASAKLSLNTGITGMALYRLNIKSMPITIRYQCSIPIFGCFFSPHYEQSYYEIFSLGNWDGIFHAASFHNQFNMDNYVSFDIPISSLSLRIGYLNTIRNTNVNEIKNRKVNHSFVIGFVKTFYPYSKKSSISTSRAIYNPMF
ncbi:MAG: DUF3316 domain-containing protein [Bacteroidales bacterium]|nr:DUF3316 domain-containing protein [Bacteroidales bacterium]